MEAWLLVLIIFVWTPPHFWALAMYRRDDYALRPADAAGHPRHGPHRPAGLAVLDRAGGLHLLPFAVGMSGLIYLAAASS
jgi:protoheme IX farnesyltransferase